MRGENEIAMRRKRKRRDIGMKLAQIGEVIDLDFKTRVNCRIYYYPFQALTHLNVEGQHDSITGKTGSLYVC
jgi:hypothetical protein